jgi:hypothetical protein
MKAPWALTVFVAATLSMGVAGPAAGQEAGGSPDASPPVRTTLPNDFSIELLGRSIIYAFSYQRMVKPALGLEASLAGLGSGSSSSGGAGLLFGSLGARVYFGKGKAAPFATAGAVLVSASTDTGPFGSGHATGKYGYTGLGFEFRSPDGLVFRATAYGLFSGGGYFIWPGLSIGYAF